MERKRDQEDGFRHRRETMGGELVGRLYRNLYREAARQVVPLPGSGSDRCYYRLTGASGNVIGVYHEGLKENDAFLSFTHTFREQGLPVPEILAVDPGRFGYLLTDLGELTLFAALNAGRDARGLVPDAITEVYRKVIRLLPVFQVRAGALIDYRKCYPREAFDRRSMMWDLTYFKYYFLKLAHVPFDEQELEEDFETLISYLLQADQSHFMYRDFQSRNIMLVEHEPWFIDYQGGRRGALPYDVASLLYDAKADLPQGIRDDLLECYLTELEHYLPGKRETFESFFPGFVLIRILQALGAYGYRGYVEKKAHFLQSIPYALSNLRHLLERWQQQESIVTLPALFQILSRLIENPPRITYSTSHIPHPESHIPSLRRSAPRNDGDPGSCASLPANLTVTIHSFAYKSGLPADLTGHGGGFVFDCRALPNPGREERFAMLTGLDQAVTDYLGEEETVTTFLENAAALVEHSIDNYLERGFTHLQVNFGCTGGQHRSVFCAEALRKRLTRHTGVKVHVVHTNLTDTAI